MTQMPSGPTKRITCPKCEGEMHTYERNGVNIEQCTNCRGVFLDFGELEALTRIEAQLAQPAPGQQQAPGYPQNPYQQAPYQQAPQGYQQYPGQHGHYDKHAAKRRGGFSGLFFSS